MRYLLVSVLIVAAFSGAAYGQTDNSEKFGVRTVEYAPYHYVDADGHTVVLGEVVNTNEFSVTGIKLWAGFFNDEDLAPLESTVSGTVLEVIPPGGTSPYMIRSPTPDPEIARVSVSFLSFNSAGDKERLLEIESAATSSVDGLEISGTIANNAGTVQDAVVYLVLYDVFEPPRTIRIESVNVTGIAGFGSAPFGFSVDIPEQARALGMFAESGDLSSNRLAMDIDEPVLVTKRATIDAMQLLDMSGDAITSVPVNTTVMIRSNLSLEVSAGQSYNQPYVYYTVVLASGSEPYAEFIGVSEGSFEGASDTASVMWTPQNPGLYFVKSYIWDPDAIPLGPEGTKIPLILVK